jgi:hypothetical protein
MLEKERGKSATLRILNWRLAIELKKTYIFFTLTILPMITEIAPQKILQDIRLECNQKGLEGDARKSP